MEDPKDLALQYLEKHKINNLFQELGTRLMFERPTDPNTFLVEALERINEAKKSKTAISFFTEKDIDTMFGMFDPTNKGYVTTTQYHEALNDVGISRATVPIPQSGRLNAQQFKHCIQEELLNNSITTAK
mmetsp:Transcript_21053/g.27659  ORF Transcript_21053/g.27659 Transcript_21053/m.27659 type:complete len:130 (-) Transcript_21053:1051-1440(-)|eukprot:CAMPEP_0117754970 /NCGR_PEP_ID=MMETSP0947-20121206/13165_1 /TAXON_ID=44440 /ORGANISM="Chattonella subsalsa, Strain CCMP2191" /LENGTH=129 /DNA_ID=CAMNT_0005574199 /DNA_START=73 /DNA_END=462 /DNA_ORIENTATION=+